MNWNRVALGVRRRASVSLIYANVTVTIAARETFQVGQVLHDGPSGTVTDMSQ